MATSQQTRVESLYHLVLEGSNIQIRENAAARLGEIARHSSQYCRAIIQQLRQFIVHNEWDVRVAAAHGIQVIARSTCSTKKSYIAHTFASVSFAGREASCPKLNLHTISLAQVLSDAAPLLRSGGEEYEYQTNLSQAERRVQVVRQRRLLILRICGKDNNNHVAMWNTPEDEYAQQLLPRLHIDHIKDLADDLEASEETIDIDKEPKVDIKRKRADEILPSQLQRRQKITHENLEDETPLLLLANLVVDLLECAFDAQWHVRHGAFLTLRAIFLHSGFLQEETKLNGDMMTLIDQWIEESLMRCLCVLALDQFADYSGDGCVAPVRELCSQVFGILLGRFNHLDLLTSYLGVLNILLKTDSWHARHGGLLGLTYLFKAHSIHTMRLMPLVLDNVIQALEIRREEEEDSVVVACHLLGTFVTCLKEEHMALMVSNTGMVLWQLLMGQRRKDKGGGLVVTAAMQALCQWYSNPITNKLLHADSVEAIERVQLVVPLLSDPDSSVRMGSCACIRAICTARILPHVKEVSLIKAIRSKLLLQLYNESLESVQLALIDTWKPVALLIQEWDADELNKWFDWVSNPSRSISSSARVATADSLGFVLSTIPWTNPLYRSMIHQVQEHMQATSGEVQFGALLFLAHWALYEKLQDRTQMLHHHIGPVLQTMAGNNWLPTSSDLLYVEQLASLHRVEKMEHRLYQLFANANVTVPPSSHPPHQTTASRSRAIAEHIAIFPYEKLTQFPDIYEQAHFRRQDLFLVDEYIQKSFITQYNRIQGIGTMAYFYICGFPSQKSGFVVKALMNALEVEADASYRALVTTTLVSFIQSEHGRQRKCVAKIVENLCLRAVALIQDEEENGNDTDNAQDNYVRQLQVRAQGAHEAIEKICSTWTEDTSVLKALPPLDRFISRAWDESMSNRTIREDEEDNDVLIQKSMHLLRRLCSTLCCSNSSQEHIISTWLDGLANLVTMKTNIVSYKSNLTRKHIARAIATLCRLDHKISASFHQRVMLIVYQQILSIVDETEPDSLSLLGAMLVLEQIVVVVGAQEITPYVPSLVHYAMKTMNDHSQNATDGAYNVRLLGAKVFADLMPLLPLQMDLKVSSSVVIKEHKLQELLIKNQVSRAFLERLLHGQAIEAVDISCIWQASPIQLRTYQQHGLNWLAFLAENQLGGILADDMGLGKTLQVLAMLASRRTQRQQTAPSLIVCPQIIVHHWMHEAQRCFPQFFTDMLDLSGGAKERKALISQLMTTKLPPLIITTYNALRADISLYTFRLDVLVLDEAHLIRNPKTALFEAVQQLIPRTTHRLALSGTPIQNNVDDLWSLFAILMPGYLGNHDIFRREYVVPISRARTMQATTQHKEQSALAITRLHQRVLPFILRRTKEEVLTELPPKIISNVLLTLTPLQQRLYHAAIMSTSTTDADRANVLSHLHVLRKIAVHPILVRDHVPSLRVTAKDKKMMSDWKQSGKMLGLRDLLVDACDLGNESIVSSHRCLIFAHLHQTLDGIEHMLSKALPSITYRRLDGTTTGAVRMNMVKQFNADPSIDLLLLTTAVGGLGLTLTGADTVIFVEHSWNPFVDLQAMDRTHRIGQTKTVRVFRLIMQDTVEEHIMDLQRFKQQVASAVVHDTDASTGANSTTTQVLSLLHHSSTAIASQLTKAKKSTAESALSQGVLLNQPGDTVLKEIGELWDHSQYESLTLPSIE